MEKIFIGMPVYNGERFIEQAIASIIDQTHTNWVLCISDNHSTDATSAICKAWVAKDKRINYRQQEENIGVAANFLFLLNAASAEYFMWAAADDTWDKHFIEACLPPLISTHDISLSFCNIRNINSFGAAMRMYPSFGRFVNTDKAGQIASFILDPEYLGKANLIYGIYKLSLCRKTMIDSLNRGMDMWGADITFVLNIILLPYNIHIDERVLFNKRIAAPADKINKPRKIQPEFSHINGIPLTENYYQPYFSFIRQSTSQSPYFGLVDSLVDYRQSLTIDIIGYKMKWGKLPLPFIFFLQLRKLLVRKKDSKIR